MTNADFDNFIRRQQAKTQDAGKLDVEQQLKEWRVYLAALYDAVETFMAGYVSRGQASIRYSKIEINEEFSGPYHVDQMALNIGPSVIAFKPVGTMLIGSKGRVDVQGPHGSARLVLLNSKVSKAQQLIRISVAPTGESESAPPANATEAIEWSWKLATPAPNVRFIDLNEQVFFDMVISVADA